MRHHRKGDHPVKSALSPPPLATPLIMQYYNRFGQPKTRGFARHSKNKRVNLDCYLADFFPKHGCYIQGKRAL